MTQVHKENLTFVENANPGRQGLEIEIFGMEGVPADIIDQHTAQVTQAHFAEEAERARITGNPVRGAMTNGANGEVVKRTRVVEDLEVLEQRADQYREDRRNGVLPVKEVVVEPVRSSVYERVSRILTCVLDSPNDPAARLCAPCVPVTYAYERLLAATRCGGRPYRGCAERGACCGCDRGEEGEEQEGQEYAADI